MGNIDWDTERRALSRCIAKVYSKGRCILGRERSKGRSCLVRLLHLLPCLREKWRWASKAFLTAAQMGVFFTLSMWQFCFDGEYCLSGIDSLEWNETKMKGTDDRSFRFQHILYHDREAPSGGCPHRSEFEERIYPIVSHVITIHCRPRAKR